MKYSVRYEVFLTEHGKVYQLLKEFVYFSPRYLKLIVVPKGFVSDGASGPAWDIPSASWWVHDRLCETKMWEDGSACSSWQRSVVLHDILLSEGRWLRGKSWFIGTLFWEVVSHDA